MKDEEKDLGATPQRSLEAGQAVPTPQLSHVERDLEWLRVAVLTAESAVLVAARVGHAELVTAIDTLTRLARELGKAEGRS